VAFFSKTMMYDLNIFRATSEMIKMPRAIRYSFPVLFHSWNSRIWFRVDILVVGDKNKEVKKLTVFSVMFKRTYYVVIL